jgi:type II secretory pathway pseudopilin PulG
MRSGDVHTPRSGGFTYLGLITTVAIIGLVGAATLKVESLLRRAAAEQDLLETGAAFSEALKSYADATPRGQPTQPPSLQELLKDPRFPGVRRHLRKIFVDPVTGKAEWGIVWVNPGNETGVLAVYSLARAAPLKVANFDARFPNFEGKQHLSDWKFAAVGQTVVQGQAPGQAQPGQQAGQLPGQPLPSLFPAPPATPQGQAAPAAAPAPVEAAAPVEETTAPAEVKEPVETSAPAPAEPQAADKDAANPQEEQDSGGR